MNALNYKHLRYFWMVARTGSIARAAEQLHLTPQSISGQLGEFADTLGVALFRRTGRTLELSEAGRRMLSYADEIFALGDEMLDVVRDTQKVLSLPLRVGVADSVSKSVAYRLLEPALQLEEPVRLICREGRLSSLLADLSVHRLDAVIADQALPANLNVRAYSHLLGESPLVLFAAKRLLDRCAPSISVSRTVRDASQLAALIAKTPFLLPGEDFAIRSGLLHWFEQNSLRPHIVGEFDDSALMRAFAEAGAGLFPSASLVGEQLCRQAGMVHLGDARGVTETYYAISVERRLTHPAVRAISEGAARHQLGGSTAD